eukprot:g833.t1
MIRRLSSFVAGGMAGAVLTAAAFSKTTESEISKSKNGGRLHHLLDADHPSRAAVAGSARRMRCPPGSKRSKVYRVVLTGGPCGGKSSSLKHFTKTLGEKGIDVYTAPEVPTIMLNGGCQYPGMDGKKELEEFETALLKLQLQMENSFTQCAASTGRPAVLVLDRGLMDPAAYIPEHQWKEILAKNGFSEDSFQAQYDLVLHLVTAADGAEKYYNYNDGKNKGNNAARLETPEQARELDRKIMDCWEGHPNQAIIKNGRPFKEKLEDATSRVVALVEGESG